MNIKNLAKGSTLPAIIAWLGIILYVVQGVLFAQIKLPNLDEGSYLYKGLLLTRGLYKPFQPYGPWINKMYLSFMTWGWVQQILSPGLWGPRLFSVGLGSLTLFGIWKFSLRWSARWLASLSVLVVALNPTLVTIYSTARPQILIIFLLTWLLVLSVASERRSWQIMLSAVLLGLIILTRENMVFVFPFWILYVFWQHGRKKGLLALFTACAVLFVGHAIYWPEIFSLWQRWLPFSIYKSPSSGQNIGTAFLTTDPGLAARLHSFSTGLRVHLIPVIGSLVVCLFWPRRKAWKTQAHYRAAIFLTLLFFTLFIAHAWASLGKNYCVFCFNEYTAFFGSIGVLLFVLSFDSLKRNPSPWYMVIIIPIVIISTAAIGYSLFEYIGDTLIKLPLPRIRYGRFLPGWANLGQILGNKFNITGEVARIYTPVVVGAVAGILLLIIGSLIFRYLKKHKQVTLPVYIAFGFLCLGGLLSPILNLPYDQPICQSSVIKYYENMGSQLAEYAPPGTRIYLDGTIVSPILLYLDDPIILLPQLNDTFSFRVGGDPDSVLRNNFWNEAWALSWRDVSHVFIIEEDRMPLWRDYLYSSAFQELPTDPVPDCSVNARIFLFIRK